MTKDDWQEAIYAALGIPVAVTDKACMANELLDRRFSPPAGAARDPGREVRRATARGAVLADLGKCLADGELDRLLVDLEDIEEVAGRVAGLIGGSDVTEDVHERKIILQYLLPGLLAVVRGPGGKQPLALPAALRAYLRTE